MPETAIDTVASAFAAQVTFAGRYRQKKTIPSMVTRLGQRSITLSLAADQSVPSDVSFMWVNVDLPVGDIRPLVQISERDGARVVGRFRHIFPDDRATLDAWHAERASAHGY